MPPLTKLRHLTLAAIATLVLAGCTTPPPPQFPELTFTHLPAITLDVAEVRIVNEFKASATDKNVEGRMPMPPAKALANWARDRLKPGGVSGVAEFIIHNGAVVGTDLKKTEGLKGVFTTDQAEKYDGTVKATLRLVGVPYVNRAFAEAEVHRSQTLGEDASINDRETMWFELTEELMRAFDPAMSTSIRQHLADYVR